MGKNRIVTELRADSAQLRTEFGKAQKKVRDFRGEIKSSKVQLIGFAAGFIGVRSGLQLFGDLVDSASDLNETLSKTSAIFGEDNAISDWATRQSESLGLSTKDALDYASRFGGALKEIGGKTDEEAERISQSLVGLSSDLASFFNSDQGQARDAIAAALTGEFEQLKKYNVVINETILKERALALGVSDGKGVLDARTKQLVALDLLYQKTGDAQGDFAKTSEGVANQERILKAQFENTRAELGQKLLPVQLEFIKIARDGIEVLGEFAPVIKVMGQGLSELTGFLVENRQAVALIAGGYLGYHTILKSFKFASIVTGLVQTRVAILANTAALTSETTALGGNTTGWAANSAARSAGLKGFVGDIRKAKIGLLGFLAAAPAVAKIGYDLGKALGGNALADTLVPDDDSRDTAEEDAIKRQIEFVRQREAEEAKLQRTRATDDANWETRQRQLREASAAQEEITKKREASRLALQKEINTIAAGVLETELANKTAREQLDAYEKQLDRVAAKTGAYSRRNGLDAPGGVDAEGAIELAREAVARGRLEVAKQLLLVAEKMQEKKAKILSLEKEIKSAEDSKKEKADDVARAAAEKQASQKAALREQAQQLTILKLRKAGREEEAAALEKEIELREKAKRIAQDTGLSEENALKLARQKSDLQAQAQSDSRPKGLDNRFDEDGNRKLARDGKRKKIVLIRRDENGNRIDSAASGNLAAKARARAAKANPLVNRTDRLIGLAERQLETLEKFQTSS